MRMSKDEDEDESEWDALTCSEFDDLPRTSLLLTVHSTFVPIF